VLDAAAKLLTDRGYANITIEGVAFEAGVGKSTIYRWWSTKVAIYIDLYHELALRNVPPPDTGNLDRDLNTLIGGAFRIYRETAAGLALAGIVAEAQSNAEVAKLVRTEFVPARRGLIQTALELAAARGELLPKTDVQMVAEILTGAVWYNLLLGDKPLSATRARQIIKAVLEGCRRRGEPTDHAHGVRVRARKPVRLE